ncbi:MAG TPA: hypothetical protein VNN25_18725 [Thermoanaerobaculia bacterium]|nr:hypothetical protein [Thermoanaerobaculia bacterium]
MSSQRAAAVDGLAKLGAIILTLGNLLLAAIVAAETAVRLHAEFCESNKAALDDWRTKQASFAGFVLKVLFAFLADLFLLHPLLVALALTMFSFSAIGLLASLITPILFIVAESIIAVKYERARQWEARFGVKGHAMRWLILGYVVAAIPAMIVIALGFVSSGFIASLGLVAFLGRQALNVILAIISFVMHILLVHSGMTPREFVDSLLAKLGKQRPERREGGALNDARRKRTALLQAASRYEHARLDEQERHGPIAPYPFPESILALIREELPNFGVVGPQAVAPLDAPDKQRPLFPVN